MYDLLLVVTEHHEGKIRLKRIWTRAVRGEQAHLCLVFQIMQLGEGRYAFVGGLPK